MRNHANKMRAFISSEQVRETLREGQQVDPRIMRPTTSAILAEAMKEA